MLEASVTDEKDYFNAMCIAEDSVGFNWKNNQWNFTKFYPNKYIVQKIKVEQYKPGKDFPRSGFCINTIGANEPFIDEKRKMKYVYGCYNIRRHGDEFYGTSSKKCMETWKKHRKGYKLISVDCEKFKLNPNGLFQSSRIPEDVSSNPDNDYKDSILVDHGTCSVL